MRVPLTVYNTRDVSVVFEFDGCEGNYYWFDTPRVLPTPWGAGAGGGVTALPRCIFVLPVGGMEQVELFVEAPTLGGLFQASIPINAIEGNETENATGTSIFEQVGAAEKLQGTWLVGISMQVLPDVLSAYESQAVIAARPVVAGEEFTCGRAQLALPTPSPN